MCVSFNDDIGAQTEPFREARDLTARPPRGCSVEVVEDELALAQRGSSEHVAREAQGELPSSRADDDDPHVYVLLSRLSGLARSGRCARTELRFHAVV